MIIYILSGFLLFLAGLIFLFQKQIILFLWRISAKERLIKIVVHFESNYYKIYYRLIPKNNFFLLDKMRYFYDKNYTIKGDVAIDKNENEINIDHKTYEFDKIFGIRDRRKKNNILELHYFYNNPTPINFNASEKISSSTSAAFIGDINKEGIANNDESNIVETVKLTSHEFTTLYENDLFIKLLSISDEKKLLMFVIFMNVIIILMVVIMAIKTFGLI